MGFLPTEPVNVAQIVADKNRIYQPEGPRIPGLPGHDQKPSNATPAQIKLLLDELGAYTEEVQKAAAEEGVTADVVMGQWQSVMSHWIARLNHYNEVLRSIPPEDAETLAGADAIYFNVTAPLLDGVYYEVLPGVVLNDEEKERMKGTGPAASSNQKPPDLYLPFSLGNQVRVYREHQRERWDKFWEDVRESASKLKGGVRDVGESALPWFIGAGIFVASAAAAAGIIYAVVQHQRYRALQGPPPGYGGGYGPHPQSPPRAA